jgi:pimeloyl-ACP methyl ester carboxylesterase
MVPFAKAIKQKGLRFLVWDKRNTMGQSGADFRNETIVLMKPELEIQVDDLYKLMKCLGMFPAVFVGLSTGSILHMHMAARHPDAVLGQVCMNIPSGPVACDILAGSLYGNFRRCASSRGMVSLKETPFYRQLIENNPEVAKAFDDPELLSFFVDYMRRSNDFFLQSGGKDWAVIGLHDGLVEKVNALTLVVHNFGEGDCDGLHTRSASEGLHKLLPNSHLVMGTVQTVIVKEVAEFVSIFLKNSYVPK